MAEIKYPTVAELIKKLKEVDSNLPIFIWNENYGYECIMPFDIEGIYENEGEELIWCQDIIVKGKAIIVSSSWEVVKE